MRAVEIFEIESAVRKAVWKEGTEQNKWFLANILFCKRLGSAEDIVEFLLGKLNKKEKDFVVSRFGLDGLGRKTLEETGKEFGVTRERVRQVEEKALRKMESVLGRIM